MQMSLKIPIDNKFQTKRIHAPKIPNERLEKIVLDKENATNLMEWESYSETLDKPAKNLCYWSQSKFSLHSELSDEEMSDSICEN